MRAQREKKVSDPTDWGWLGQCRSLTFEKGAFFFLFVQRLSESWERKRKRSVGGRWMDQRRAEPSEWSGRGTTNLVPLPRRCHSRVISDWNVTWERVRLRVLPTRVPHSSIAHRSSHCCCCYWLLMSSWIHPRDSHHPSRRPCGWWWIF